MALHDAADEKKTVLRERIHLLLINATPSTYKTGSVNRSANNSFNKTDRRCFGKPQSLVVRKDSALSFHTCVYKSIKYIERRIESSLIGGSQTASARH